MKINAQLKTSKVLEMKHLLKKFKNVFAWAYKDLKGIPLKLAQHKIELDAIIPPMSQPHFGQHLEKVKILSPPRLPNV